MDRQDKNLPLLSIVIATRNRIPYAISTIESILEISDSRLELIIQDNSDSRELGRSSTKTLLTGGWLTATLRRPSRPSTISMPPWSYLLESMFA